MRSPRTYPSPHTTHHTPHNLHPPVHTPHPTPHTPHPPVHTPHPTPTSPHPTPHNPHHAPRDTEPRRLRPTGLPVDFWVYWSRRWRRVHRSARCARGRSPKSRLLLPRRQELRTDRAPSGGRRGDHRAGRKPRKVLFDSEPIDSELSNFNFVFDLSNSISTTDAHHF